MSYYVHPSSIIDDNCTIGDGTKIWHFSHVMSGAVYWKKLQPRSKCSSFTKSDFGK